MNARLVLPALYAASGAVGLSWQVLWVRAFTPVFGAGLEAVAAVTSTFLAGLALGAALGPRLVDRLGGGRSYGLLELAVGAWGALLPWALVAGGDAVVGALAWSGEGSGATAIRLALAALLVGPPAVALGATFPAVVQAAGATVHPERVGLLYGLNALGGAAGALVAGLWLPWALGLVGGSLALGAANALIGLAALALIPARAPRAAAASSPVTPAPRTRSLLWALAAVTGFTALGLEVTWSRLAGPLLAARFEGDAGAFAGVLAAVLAGMGLGSLAGSRLGRTRPGTWVAVAQGGLALACLAVLEPARAAVLPVGGTRVLEALLPLVPALWLGASFPVLANALMGRQDALRDAGRLYAINTLGSVVGSLAAAFALVPWLGAQRLVVVLAALAMATALVALASERPRLAATLALPALAAVALPLRWSPVAGERLLHPDERLVDALEGREATTLVAERPDGERLLVSGGHRIASASRAAFDDHALRARGPARLSSSPERVLLVGLGTGETARAFLEVEGVRHVRCVELDENQAALLEWFDTASILDDPRFELVAGDGRHHLRTHEDAWDVIAVDAYGPRTASAAFYTREFYAEAAARLAPGGLVFVKFDPLAIPDEEVLSSYLAALFQVFEAGRLVYVERGLFGLVGSTAPLERGVVAADPGGAGARWKRVRPVTDAHPVRVPLATHAHPEVLRPWWRGPGLPPWEGRPR